MNRSLAAIVILAGCAPLGCGTKAGTSSFSPDNAPTSTPSTTNPDGGAGSASGSSGSSSGSDNLGGGSGTTVQLGTSGAASGAPEDAGPGTGILIGDGSTPTSIAAIIRDFRFYDAGDPTTDPDFENPPLNTNGDGGAQPGYAGPWDDRVIVTDTIGPDDKPVYKNPGGTTLTTHGQAAFNNWFNDVAGTNIHVDYALPITQNADGSLGYDSQVSGVPYATAGEMGNGFFPIDDGSPYQTAFGNQGKPHNYSFTVEIHTVFTYNGGEYFQFRGDDDIFVYINNALVINLGGIHAAEPGNVMIDSLGLTVGQTYPLDFFSAERHVTGSNIQFTTTLTLQPKIMPR